MTLGRRIAELFVAPAERPLAARERSEPHPTATPAVAPPAASVQPAPAVAVLAPPADAPALGAALALALARARRAPVAVVCVWSATPTRPTRPTWRAPARPAAIRLAAWLAGRGHAAQAAGRLVLVRLADAEDDAATEALRVSAAAGAAPTVLALAGPRRAAFDVALAAQDLVVVAVPAAADPALAQLAAAGLERALICPLPPADPARALAAAGLTLLPSVRRALAVPVTALTMRGSDDARNESGQATILLLGVVLAVVLGALVLGAVARGIGAQSDEQRAADLAALAGARAMHDAYGGLFEPARLGGRANPAHLERAAYLERGRKAALVTARRNGARDAVVSFPDEDTFAPVRMRVAVRDPVEVGARERVAAGAVAEAELVPPSDVALWSAGPGEYQGPLEQRQGKPMRPDVARAFDRMEAAARHDGVALAIVSGFRTNAEQAVLFARHPDPKWVAPPGQSLHRLGTELDLGPEAAYGWLAANAKRFHFVQRYSWEPWHYGFELNAGTTSVGFSAKTSGGDGETVRALPSFVPAAYAEPLARAAQRWNVSSALLAAQLMAESNFNPFAVSSAGARGIAQFMPATAKAMGLHNPLDPEASIDAQAHLMRDLLRQFGSVPLALAAYNAGPTRVAACGCVPPIPETRGYVARILGLLGGAGEVAGDQALEVRLVR